MERSRGTWFGAVAALLLCAAVMTGCSEPAPDSEGSAKATTSIPVDNPCEGDSMIECARKTSIADLVPAEPTKATGEPLKIGMINQENTPAGSFPELSQAVQAAVEFVNTQLGGVDGRPVEVQVCNTEFSAEGSTKCAQQFVDEEVPVVLGGIDVFGNGIDTLKDNGIPYVGGIPISEQSATRSNSFQFSGGTWGAAVAFASDAIAKKAKKVSIVYGEFGSITQSAGYGKKVLDAAGIQTQMVPYPILSTDLSSPVQAALAGDPDAVIVLAADTGCKPAFQALAAANTKATAYFTGACAAPPIVEDVPQADTEGRVFNVEQLLDPEDPDVDGALYFQVIDAYGKGLDPVGAGTVSFRSFMNLYAVLRGLGADGITPKAVTSSLKEQVDTSSFMGHPYTCDGKQFEGLPAMCSPQQALTTMEDRTPGPTGGWIDVGQIYAG